MDLSTVKSEIEGLKLCHEITIYVKRQWSRKSTSTDTLRWIEKNTQKKETNKSRLKVNQLLNGIIF
jgi:hypothetical protein